jgi:hypothetical protein
VNAEEKSIHEGAHFAFRALQLPDSQRQVEICKQHVGRNKRHADDCQESRPSSVDQLEIQIHIAQAQPFAMHVEGAIPVDGPA